VLPYRVPVSSDELKAYLDAAAAGIRYNAPLSELRRRHLPESGAPADDWAEATTPAASGLAPAVDPPPRRAAKAAAKPCEAGPRPKTTTPAAETPPAAGGRGRPPADEIMWVYKQANGKLTELAKHYGKPVRHASCSRLPAGSSATA
jgi:hypothetical protein